MEGNTDILITGASGMLGAYLKEELKTQLPSAKIFSLGRDKENDFCCNLSSEKPDFRNRHFKIVAHCAGTEKKKDAASLNIDGTRRLLEALENNPPEYFIYISSFRVYNPDSNDRSTEDSSLLPSGEPGISKLNAERIVTDWSKQHGVTLSIIRPALMFGNGVGGDTLRLFNDALNGNYIHIRGNNARVSLVTALDVAKGIVAIYQMGGIYNAADGTDPEFLNLVEAMTANAGRQKRQTHLPADWAEWIWRLGKWIPFIDRNLNPETVAERMKSTIIDGTKFAETAGLSYFNTINVISRTDKTYPYSES